MARLDVTNWVRFEIQVDFGFDLTCDMMAVELLAGDYVSIHERQWNGTQSIHLKISSALLSRTLFQRLVLFQTRLLMIL